MEKPTDTANTATAPALTAPDGSRLAAMSDEITIKTVIHSHGKAVWLTPKGWKAVKDTTHGYMYSDAPWAIIVSKSGIGFEEDSRINPTDFRVEQFLCAFRIANEIWLDEFFCPENVELTRGTDSNKPKQTQ